MSTPKDTAISAAWQLMEPIIGILLRNGVTHKDLVQVCKQLYVKVASDEFGIRGRPTNLSRVAIMTGIDRKEVGRIKDNLQQDNRLKESLQHQDRLTRILSGWYQDAEFLDADGQPKLLPLEGEQSFELLVRRYGGDLPASALLKELKRVGLVEEIRDKLRVLGRYFVVDAADPAALLRAGSVIQDIAELLEFNLYKANPAKNKPKRFERRATNPQIPAAAVTEFRQWLEQEGQAFLERADAWLSQHESNDSHQPKIRLGVGTYLIETETPIETEIPIESEIQAPTESGDVT